MTINEAVDVLDDFCVVHGEERHKEAWQTLKSAVLGTTPNTRIEKLLCKLKEYIESDSEWPIQKDSWFHDEINAVLAQLHNA
jgi:hypothetical protein